MPVWVVTRTEVWTIESETGPDAVAKVAEDGESLDSEFDLSAETVDGEQPCEGCGKPATYVADFEGVPLCQKCTGEQFSPWEKGDGRGLTTGAGGVD